MNAFRLSVVALLLVVMQAWGTELADRAELQRKLSTELTPMGAVRAGNVQGTIPPWSGGITAPPIGWQAQQGYRDPFAQDEVLFTITRENMRAHLAQLTPGLAALLNKVSGFAIPVFTARRSAAIPKAVADEVVTQAGSVVLDGTGVAMKQYHPVPFPVPQNGLEVIWNHLLRYLGGSMDRSTHAFPVRPNGDYYRIGFHSRRIYESQMDKKTDNRLFSAMGEYTEPATLLGTTFLVHEPLNQVKERRSAWIYNAGMRRVRRAPDLGFDGIPDGSEGMFTADQIDGYNGSPERYDWALQGKQEVYVPYNSYRLGGKGQKDGDIIRRGTVNPALMRYELHRVWVVEARLKSGESHIYGKRVFYIDEDSWSILEEDAYSTRGDLWRVALHGLMQYYDAQVPWYRFSLYHDLQSGTYFLGGLDNGIEAPVRFGIRGSLADFQPDALRRAGTR